MIILDKKPVPGTERVRQDIVFSVPVVRNFSKKPKIIGLHWTGGEGSPTTLKKVLSDRNCSVHFNVAANGDIWQFADLNSRCIHIGSPWNDLSFGIEVTCRGYATKEDFDKAKLTNKDLKDRSFIDWHIARDFYADIIDGKEVKMASFSKEQIDSIIWLCNKLSEISGIKKIIPYKEISDINSFKAPVKDSKSLIVNVSGKNFVPSFERGVKVEEGSIGHFHVHDTKHDPGTQPLYALWANGWNPSGQKLKVDF